MCKKSWLGIWLSCGISFVMQGFISTGIHSCKGEKKKELGGFLCFADLVVAEQRSVLPFN